MTTPKITPAEALLRRRAFYLRISRDTLRTATARTKSAQAPAPTPPAQTKPPGQSG